MNREIKFRLIKDGKIVGYEKWYPGEKHSPDSGMEGWAAEPRWLYSYNNKVWGITYISCDTKEQYIGRKNKNGVEIYERDKVKTRFQLFDDYGNPTDKLAERTFDIKWSSNSNRQFVGFDLFPFSDLDDIEVIGN